MERKIIYRWLKVIIILYSVIGIALYYLQELFLFHPKKLPSGYAYHFDTPFEEINIPINQTDTVNMVKFFPKDAIRRGVVLYFHANTNNIERYARFAANFTRHGYEVWMEDYPGYGKSRGERTEKKLYEEAMQVQKMALRKYGKDSIIIYGRSIGTGIAAYVASVSDCKRLILETPYYSIPSLFGLFAPLYPTSAMSDYKLPVNEFLQDVRSPVSIFHGTDDWVVPLINAARLRTVLKPTDEFIIIKNGGHRNLNDFKAYHDKLDSLLELR